MKSVLLNIRKELKEKSDPVIQAGAKRYFKEKIKVFGLKTFKVTQISKKYFTHIKTLPKKEIFSLSEELMKSGFMEESFIACHWSYALHQQFTVDDFTVFSRWVHQYVSNWATCDTLCNHTIGSFIERFPKFTSQLKVWTKSNNRWVKRASAVSLIVPAKKGLFLNDIIDIADRLLTDKDDMVQKGYGWLLKEASKSNQKKIFEYVLKNKKIMPRTALRYAIEKMPLMLKKRAMEK